MGLIKALKNAAGGVLEDQWKEYFYCDSMPADVLVTKGRKKMTKRFGGSRTAETNVITNGSVIAVNEGQCMLIVDQGKVVDLCAEPGEYIYDMSTEASLFSGDLAENISSVFESIGKRLSFGGEVPVDQRVYYVNTKELMGNKYGTPGPVPFRVVDANVGLDIDISIRCFGEYSYRIANPILFYSNVCGNVERDYTRAMIESQLKSELMTALQPAFARISGMGIRYSALPGHTTEIAATLNQVLSDKWKNLRGIEIVSFGVSSVKASEEDEEMLKELQKTAVYRNPGMAAAHLVNAQAQAMQSAASNSAGAAMGFMGMNMAANAGGMNAQDLFMMNQQNQMAQMQAQNMQNNQMYMQGQNIPNNQMYMQGQNTPNNQMYMQGQSIPNQAAQPSADTWTCSCGAVNTGKFCPECGAPRVKKSIPAKCSNCGWGPADPSKTPKFCPECGTAFVR